MHFESFNSELFSKKYLSRYLNKTKKFTSATQLQATGHTAQHSRIFPTLKYTYIYIYYIVRNSFRKNYVPREKHINSNISVLLSCKFGLTNKDYTEKF